MRSVSGVEALHRLRRLEAPVEVVMLSAYDDRALMADALAAGAFAYLVKGCPADELFSTLESAWRHARSRRGERG
jgi:DNA-binding NarL/FixJ family response regulator